MFAVIKTGGKQYRVAPGDVLTVEKLEGANGDQLEFKDVLMLSDGKKAQIGAPLVSGAVVKVRIINQERADKIIVFKKIRRHNYRRKNGHRQHQTAVQIVEIAGKGISGKAEKLVAPKPLPGTEAPVAKAAKKPEAKKAAPAKKAPAKAAAPKAEKPAEKKAAAPKKPSAKKSEAKPAAKKPAAKKAAPKAKK